MAMNDEFLPDDEAWKKRAACLGSGVSFFPDPAETSEMYRAKKICRACPVRSQCLDYALSLPDQIGIWGGLSARERRRLLLSQPHWRSER